MKYARSVAVPTDPEALLTPGEVAVLFRVDPKTVTRWAAAGRLPSIRTPGGHRRFRWGDVEALRSFDVAGQTAPATGAATAAHKPWRRHRITEE